MGPQDLSDIGSKRGKFEIVKLVNWNHKLFILGLVKQYIKHGG